MIPPHTKAIPLTPLRGPQARRGIFLPTRPAAGTDTLILALPVFLSKHRQHPFLPTRPVAGTNTLILMHPVFLSKYR